MDILVSIDQLQSFKTYVDFYYSVIIMMMIIIAKINEHVLCAHASSEPYLSINSVS